MNYTQKEIDMLKNAHIYEEVEIKKYEKYLEEINDAEIKKALKQIITIDKDHLNLINTMLKQAGEFSPD
ncbi:MAG: hypothetical protein CVT98_01500 [Bacteroidetes bacterium HGW-Bacteroidetes-15]|nr:MAG: hypothetical protein CVT98_01500 [Bacteroidetes bacterium HGW-Bacteroidetes-15]